MDLKPKFKPTDEVWVMFDNAPTKAYVYKITTISQSHGSDIITEIYYDIFGITSPIREEKCFGSLDDLLNSFRELKNVNRLQLSK